MNKSKLAKKSLIIIVFIAFLHFLANTFYWYVSIWWFDNLMHFLGGAFLAFFGATLFFNQIKNKTNKNIFVFLIFLALIFGIGWEAFEYATQFFIKDSEIIAHKIDSIFDLIFDILGGMFATLFVLKQKSMYNNKHE